MTISKRKVKSILISQPKPEVKSPYAAIEKKYKLKIDYRPFIHVEEISTIEFREQRISILNHDSVIFTSKHAMDHYFGMCEKLRIKVPDYTKYFCVSEAIAHYLQNFITFRKRKVFTGEQSFASLIPVMQKHSDSKFIFPCSDVLKNWGLTFFEYFRTGLLTTSSRGIALYDFASCTLLTSPYSVDR